MFLQCEDSWVGRNLYPVKMFVCMVLTYFFFYFISLGVSLFGVCSDLRVVYTPPLFWMPHAPPPHPGHAPLSTVAGSSRSKSSVLATGHCIEVNLTSDVVLLCGTEQVLVRAWSCDLSCDLCGWNKWHYYLCTCRFTVYQR